MEDDLSACYSRKAGSWHAPGSGRRWGRGSDGRSGRDDCPAAQPLLPLRAHVHAAPPASTALPVVVPAGGVQAAARPARRRAVSESAGDDLFRVPFE